MVAQSGKRSRFVAAYQARPDRRQFSLESAFTYVQRRPFHGNTVLDQHVKIGVLGYLSEVATSLERISPQVSESVSARLFISKGSLSRSKRRSCPVS